MSVAGLRYPWSVLEIPPTEDEKAIRKAYAAKLRVTRPDEDPEGFQALREARDHAMAQSRYLALPDDDGPDEPVPAEPSIVKVEEPDVPSNRPSSDVGKVEFAALFDTPEGGIVDEAPDILELLEQVGRPHPWRGLGAQWADVFEAMERAPLADHSHNMAIVLQRLLDDVRQRVGNIPDIVDWQVDTRAADWGQFGPYADILRDFESRFGILKQDTMLLEYLDDEDARDFTTALTIAAGREITPQPSQRPVINVEPIHADFVNAAWGNEPKMLEYYEAAVKKDAFSASFSWLALLFPLPFALYYRLTAIAGLVAILVAANTVFQILKARGTDVPLGGMASIVYLITAVAVAVNWRRIRVQALASRVRRLMDQQLGSQEIQERVRRAMAPSRSGMWIGVVALVAVVVARLLAR